MSRPIGVRNVNGDHAGTGSLIDGLLVLKVDGAAADVAFTPEFLRTLLAQIEPASPAVTFPCPQVTGGCGGDGVAAIEGDICSDCVLELAIAIEREECARLIEGNEEWETTAQAAAAIRARGVK